MRTPEQIQILQRIDRALTELREIRAAVAGEHDADELSDADRAELAALADRRAARLRKPGGR